MNDRVVLFDFDGTLLNTSKLFENLIKEVLPKSTNKKATEIESISSNYLNSLISGIDFDPIIFLELISEQTSTDISVITNDFYQPELYLKSVYPEAIDVISQLKTRYPIGVFTQGNPEWQRKKLELSGLISLLDPSLLFISRRKTSSQFISKVPKPCIIVDDNIEIINILKNVPDVAPIFLDRYKKMKDPNSIHDLNEVISLL